VKHRVGKSISIVQKLRGMGVLLLQQLTGCKDLHSIGKS